MRLFKSFIACFSTYSKIPMPTVDLDSEDMKYVFVFFPIVGVVIGVLEYISFILCTNFGLPRFFRACIAVIIPIILTGGIHIDGYMDTKDALCSYGDKEKKLAIMKDPHTGGFAIINLIVYMICYIAFMYIVNEKSIIYVCYSFVFSRILSGISVVTIKSAKANGMLSSVKNNSEQRKVFVVLLVMTAVISAFLFTIDIRNTSVFLIISVLGFLIYKRKVLKEFDGITGDTSGYFLCVMELVFLIAASICGII